MASLHKHPASAVSGMIRHNERTLPPPRDGHIDAERASDNYYIPLASDREPGHAYDAYKTRLSEIKHMDRKDVVHMASWVVTLPKDADDADAFFASVTAFLCDRYGRENAISAIVHADETTPHLHFLFVPATEDGRLCAKEVLCRSDLRTFHADLQKHLQKHGINGTVTNGVKNAKSLPSSAVSKQKGRW